MSPNLHGVNGEGLGGDAQFVHHVGETADELGSELERLNPPGKPAKGNVTPLQTPLSELVDSLRHA